MAVNPAAGGSISCSGWYNVGGPAVVTVGVAPGYRFRFFSGDLSGNANPQTLVMNGPKNVVANFAALVPALNASVVNKAGTAAARTWTLQLPNPGLDWADNTRITRVAITQVSGAPCSPAATLSTPLPLIVGTLAASGGTATVPVIVNFAGCSELARFGATFGFEAKSGAYTGSTEIRNQYR